MKTCIAPIDDSSDPVLCGQPAVTEVLVEGLLCPLCAAHAAEFEDEDKEQTMTTNQTRSPLSLAIEAEPFWNTGCRVETIPKVTGDYLADLRLDIERRENELRERTQRITNANPQVNPTEAAGHAANWQVERRDIEALQQELRECTPSDAPDDEPLARDYVRDPVPPELAKLFRGY